MPRLLLGWLSAATIALLAPVPALAQDYPTQPIKMIVAFGVGGGSDIVSRIIAQRMAEKLGQPVIVENRTGSGGMIGNETVANAPKDGYTLANMSAAQMITAALTKQMRFHPIEAFDPIGQVAEAGLIISVRPDFPAKSVRELIEMAKAEPDKLVFASPGFGGTQHLAAEWFTQVAGIKMRHVPFRTSPEAMTAMLGRQVDVLFDTVTAVLGQVQAGEVRAIAVTGARRGEGRTTVVQGLTRLLRDRGRNVVCFDRGDDLAATTCDDDDGIALVDAGVWFPPGPLRRRAVERASLGCDAVIMVRRADEAPCAARASVVEAIGLEVLGEVVTFSTAAAAGGTP